MPGKKKQRTKTKFPLEGRKNTCFNLISKVNIIAFCLVILTSVVMFITAIILYSALSSFQSLLSITLPSGFIVISLFLTITSVVALIGIKKKLLRAIQVALALLVIFVIIEFAIGGATYGLRNTIPGSLQNWWNNAYPQDKNNIQSRFNCCGFSNPSDSPGPNCVNTNSSSVEMMEVELESFEFSEKAAVNSNVGCKSLLIAAMEKDILPLGIVGIVFAFIQLFALILCIIYYILLWREENRSYLEVD